MRLLVSSSFCLALLLSGGLAEAQRSELSPYHRVSLDVDLGPAPSAGALMSLVATDARPGVGRLDPSSVGLYREWTSAWSVALGSVPTLQTVFVRAQSGAALDGAVHAATWASAQAGAELSEDLPVAAPRLTLDLLQFSCANANPDLPDCTAEATLALFEPGASSAGWSDTVKVDLKEEAFPSIEEIYAELVRRFAAALQASLTSGTIGKLARAHDDRSRARLAAWNVPHPPPGEVRLVNGEGQLVDAPGYGSLPAFETNVGEYAIVDVETREAIGVLDLAERFAGTQIADMTGASLAGVQLDRKRGGASIVTGTILAGVAAGFFAGLAGASMATGRPQYATARDQIGLSVAGGSCIAVGVPFLLGGAVQAGKAGGRARALNRGLLGEYRAPTTLVRAVRRHNRQLAE